MRNIIVIVVFMLLMPCALMAGGFGVNWQGAKATSMGEAFTGLADDPSALYYNPAGITKLDGINIMIGTSFVTTEHTFVYDNDGKSYAGEEGLFVIPHLFYTQKYNDKISFGLGVFANYGLGTEHDENFPTKYLLGNRKTEISTMSINPNIAYQVNTELSVAFGAVFQQASLLFENNLNTGSDDAFWKMDMDDSGELGWNTAVLYKINNSFQIGATYRSQIKHDLSGDSKVTGSSTYESLLAGNISTNVTMPAIASCGVAYKKGRWTFDADLYWTQWSKFDELYIPELLGGTSSSRNYKDTISYHLGADCKIDEMFSVRFGFVYDPTPVPDSTFDPTLPTGDRYVGAVGLGIKKGLWVFDIGYQYIYDKGNKFNNSASTDAFTGTSYTGDVKDVQFDVVGISVTRSF